MASRLQDVIARGLAADKPLATDVAIGTLYFSSDTNVLERSNGSTWESYSAAAPTSGMTQLTGDVTAGPGGGSQAATIAPNAVVTAKLADGAVTSSKIANIATDKLLGRDTAGTGPVQEIGVTGGIQFDGAGNIKLTQRRRTIIIPFDGGSESPALGTGLPVSVNFNGNIVAVRTFGSNPAGSAVVDIWKSVYSSYPPVVAGSITGSSPPTLSGSNKSEDLTLTGWTPAIAVGNIFMGNLVSVDLHRWVVVFIDIVEIP